MEFWTAIGGIAQGIAAIATFCAVLVALHLGKKEEGRFLQARYDAARPVLLITSDGTSIPVHQGDGTCINWEEHPVLTIRNVGNGTAFNVRSVIYGPEMLSSSNYFNGWQHRIDEQAQKEKEYHWYHWTTDALPQGEAQALSYTFANTFNLNTFAPKHKNLHSKGKKWFYALNAPKQPLQSHNVSKEPWCLCRVTITYEDIFHRNHASIYDLIYRQGWQVVALLDDIEHTLCDLITK